MSEVVAETEAPADTPVEDTAEVSSTPVEATNETEAAEAAPDVPKTLLSDDGGGEPEGDELVWQPPEGVEVTEAQQAQLGEFAGMAKDMGLSKEQFQKLIDFDVQRGQDLYEQQVAGFHQQITSWGEQTKSDSELGGAGLEEKLAIAKLAQDKVSNPELNTLLNAPSPDNPNGLGLGNHPEVIRLFYKIGSIIKDPALINGGGGTGADQDILRKTYPSMFPSDN